MLAYETENITSKIKSIIFQINSSLNVTLVRRFTFWNEAHTYDFKAPKRGRITELIVSRECCSNGVGKQLLNKMENYFKEAGCKGIFIDVFAYNENAQKFYYKNGYFDRNIEVMKKI